MNIVAGKSGFVNPKGEIVIPCIYDFVSDFGYDRDGDIGFDGLAYVNIGASEDVRMFIISDGKWGIINTHGEVILPVIYGDISRSIENMAYIVDGNRADMFPADGGKAIAKMGFVNRKGEIVIPVEYDYNYDAYFDEGYVELKK